jgi:hypothetical protein
MSGYFHARADLPQRKDSPFPSNTSMGGPPSQSRSLERNKDLLNFTGNRTLDRLAPRTVTTASMPSRLRFSHKTKMFTKSF